MKNVPGNYYDKYHTNNPIARRLMNGFFASLHNNLISIDCHTILDAGCGEGELSNYIHARFPEKQIEGIELEDSIVELANKKFPTLKIASGNIYNLPYLDGAFDLTMGCEVLEHLEDPRKALFELLRVSRRYVLVSVPREPIWRVCNLARAKYIGNLGNTPGHIQHWSKDNFTSFISQYARITKISSPFPWTMVLAEKQY